MGLMSKVDRIKEEIGLLKLVFGACIAIDVSLIAWIAQHYETADTVLLVLASIGVVLVTLIFIAVNRAAFKRIAHLEDL